MSLQLHGAVADIVQEQVSKGGYKSAEDFVGLAIQALTKQQISDGIEEGLADVEAGRTMVINAENIDDVLAKPLDQW